MKKVTIVFYATDVSENHVFEATYHGTVIGIEGRDNAKAHMHDGTELAESLNESYGWEILEQDSIGDDGSPTLSLILHADDEGIGHLRALLEINSHEQGPTVSEFIVEEI